MPHILPEINTLEQHSAHLSSKPDDYRPDCCPHCGKGGLWSHGCYTRQSDREHGSADSLNPVRIPRFQLICKLDPNRALAWFRKRPPMKCACCGGVMSITKRNRALQPDSGQAWLFADII